MSQTPPRPWSIRRRLTRRVLVLVTLAWALTIVLATLFLDHEVNEMMDEELQAVVQTTVLSLDASPGPVIPRSLGVDVGNGERVLRILRQDHPEPEAPWPALHADGFHQVAGWRVLRKTAEGAVIEVAHNNAWRREEMLEAASALVILILPMLAMLLWGLRHSLRRGFAPLDALTAALTARRPADLTPFVDAGLPSELRPLSQGLNSYIGRIDELRQAERQFVANASHELRTPVAAIRAQLDLSTDPQARAALPLLDGLTRRVERLLQLSRSEAGLGLGRGPADLVQILRLLVREVGMRAKHPIRFDDGDFEQMILDQDADALAIVFRNLLENAVEHGSGPVLLQLREGYATISNPAPGGVFLSQAFAKGASSGGLGLGLTITEQLCATMGIGLVKGHSDDMAMVRLKLKPAQGQGA